MKTLQLLLFFLCSAAFAEAQTPEQYLNAMKDTLTGVETFQYKALMRTKRMGGDQFKDRHFEVYAKWNPQYSGINYPFDWQIIERKKGYDLIFFFINNDFFSVVNSEKFVVHDQNVYHLDKHSFFEYMRWLVFFDELSGAPAVTYTGSSMKFDDNYTTEELLAINIKTFETVDRVLCLNKKSMFPERVIDINRDPTFNMEQIIEVHLSDISLNKALPDSVLSPRYYIEKGFNFIPPKPLEPKPESISEPLRDQKFANLLVKSPLILPTGDTTMLERLDSSLLLIDFWYMSCPPCIKAMPYLQNLEKKYGPRGLKLIGINCQDIENKASVARKLNEIGIQYTNYFIEKVYSKTLDIKGYPTMILLNKNREVIASGLGRIENLEFLIEKELK